MRDDQIHQLTEEGEVYIGPSDAPVRVHYAGGVATVIDRYGNEAEVQVYGLPDDQIPAALERELLGIIDEWTDILRAVRGER
jgi:hypothetical protein